MPVSRDILQMYRRPRHVVRALYAMGPREDRAIAWLMIGCLLYFVSLLPITQRDIVQNGTSSVMPGVETIQQAITTQLFGALMVLPLMFYLFAGIAWGITRLVRPGATAYGARLAVFWGWLASMPLALFFGLLVGLNGADEAGTQLIGIVWIGVLLWFWISGLAETSKVK